MSNKMDVLIEILAQNALINKNRPQKISSIINCIRVSCDEKKVIISLKYGIIIKNLKEVGQ